MLVWVAKEASFFQKNIKLSGFTEAGYIFICSGRVEDLRETKVKLFAEMIIIY